MSNQNFKWKIVNQVKSQKFPLRQGRERQTKVKTKDVVNILLENRGIKTIKQKEDFFNPEHPENLSIKDLGINVEHIKKAIRRIKEAVENNEEIIIYGDYDADGICATAILWEVLYSLTKKVKPYIPDRFEEGYGINTESIKNLKIKNPNVKLIITVDNGIVAYEAIDKSNELGIDVIVTDHHQPHKALTSSRGLHPRVGNASMRGNKVYDFPNAFAVIHTTKISGAGVSWIFARELLKSIRSPISIRKLNSNLKINKMENSMEIGSWRLEINKGLDLCAIGTIADQMPLLYANRSFAKNGLEALNKTKREGLLALFIESGLTAFKGGSLQGRKIGTYEVNFVIAPRLNAMGRMEHAIDSLRLLCIKSKKRAQELAGILGRTNIKRQKVVNDVLMHAREQAGKKTWKGVILLSHESYHEGVIGLAASKLVEEFRRPAIVLSKGRKISKASARSISGFNIIDSIRKLDDYILSGGGHPMAAGFSIETNKIDIFKEKLEKLSDTLLTDEVLTKEINIDMEIDFREINYDLFEEIEKFEPSGIGNPTPVFVTKKANLVDARTVGADGKHLKLVVERNGLVYGTIAFGMGDYYIQLIPRGKVDIVYSLDRDNWNGNNKLQLKIKDMRIKKQTSRKIVNKRKS